MARLVNNERNKKVSKTVKLTSNKPKNIYLTIELLV